MADIKGFFTSLYQRMSNGDHYNFMEIFETGSFGLTGSNLDIAQNHPILTPALLFTSKIFSQCRFEMINENTGKKVTSNPYLDLLNNPNHYQTSIDLFETLHFMMVAQGYAIGYKKKTPGVSIPNSLYILNPELIKWPERFKTKMMSYNNLKKETGKIIYDESGANEEIKIKDLIFFYDMPNGLQKNFFKAKSRIDGLRQTLENTNDSLTAKNIILKTNGKELITSKSNGVPFTPEEKDRIEKIYQANYGLSKKKKRAIITRADVSHKSLHIALRDLGLDESIKVDGNLIYTALHIPKDILSLEAKKTTYNNFKESMVSFIQNEMQGTLDYVLSVINKDLKETYKNFKLIGSYDHLPVMQFVLLERYKVAETRGKALTTLRNAGLPDEIALEMCDLDSNIKLKEIKNEKPEENGSEGENEEGSE